MSEEMLVLTDEQAVEFGFAPAPAPVSEPVVEAQKETPAAETNLVTTPPADKPAESVSPKPDVVPPVGESGKPLYTPGEIEEILKADGTLDSSRLDANGKLLQKSFQRGTSQKFEQAKKMREEAEAKLAEFNRRQKEIEDQKVFQKEAEELGEEEAARRKEIREIKEEQAQLRWERDQARQRELSMQIGNEYHQVAPKYHIPAEQVFEDLALSFKWTKDIARAQQGQEPLTMDEGNQMVADAIGLTNFDNLKRLVNANPENAKALKSLYVNEYLQEKAKGPTVSPSSSANVQTEKKLPADDSKKDIMDIVREAFNVPPGGEIKLTNE